MADIPYLARGINLLGTDSSVLVSSSKYLNHPRLREWIAMIALKKNGSDYPPAVEMHELIGILQELRDFDHIEAMFTEERKVNPALDAWFKEWFVSDYVIDDLANCAPGTVGGIYSDIAKNGSYEIQIVPYYEPKTQWDFYSIRSGQTHDYEHILTGGGFNYMGELIPYWFRLSTIHTHIQNKELAGEMSVIFILGTMRYVIRTMLHYPQVWETALTCIQQGIRVGRESDGFWMAKMEDVWNTPLEEARAKLGVRGAVDLDTRREGAIWSGIGMKADINIIDMDRLTLPIPHIVHDLPASGRRLDQAATGYDATIVSGSVIRRMDKGTGVFPGRLVRGAVARAS